MDERQPGNASPPRIVAALRELIGALDRRVPRVERMGETRIARDAAVLRREALIRIEELRQAGTAHRYDEELVEAIMTDDGGPARDLGSDARL